MTTQNTPARISAPNTTNQRYDVLIQAVVPITDRPNLVPYAHQSVEVADCNSSSDWHTLPNGEIIPTKTKRCIVTKTARNGSFFACGRWFRALTTQVYVHSSFIGGTRFVYL